MKHLHFLVVAVLAAMALTATGCKSKSSQPVAKDSVVADAKDDTLAVDSIVYKEEPDTIVSSIVKVDYPTGDDALAQSVRQFICQELAKQYQNFAVDGEDGKKASIYKGSQDKGQAVVDFYGKANLKDLTELRDEMLKDMDSPVNIPGLSNEIEIRKAGENPRYITYHVTGFTYLGGAHGSAVDYCKNISKATGKVLTETVDTLKTKELQPILRKGIIGYINKYEQGANDKNLNSYLFIENGIIPVPAIAPYLSPDGVHFIYQQYEIGPYAMGMIEFTVPYDKIKPYLTTEAKKLIE